MTAAFYHLMRWSALIVIIWKWAGQLTRLAGDVESRLARFHLIRNYLTNEIYHFFRLSHTAQKMKFSFKDFFSKCDQICRKLRIWSHSRKKSLMENFIYCAVPLTWPTRSI